METIKALETDVCIVGGGPAGAMLAYDLAKRGCKVLVIERSTSYEREFRGEWISPDTVQIFKQIGVFEAVQAHGYIESKKVEFHENGNLLLIVDFSNFDYECKYPIDFPQPVLLEALIKRASQFENFSLIKGASVQDLIMENDQVCGVIAKSSDTRYEIRSRLVVAADGRYGRVRELSGLAFDKRPIGRDIVWFKVEAPAEWGTAAKLFMRKDNHLVILPTFPNMLRVGFNIPSGQYKEFRKQPISALHERVADLAPDLADAVKTSVASWADTSLLDIFSTYVPTWYKKGVVLMGDAAHTLTPILGQGVNHAIQDAMSLAPLIEEGLAVSRDQIFPLHLLKKFQSQREGDVSFVRGLQLRQEFIFKFSGRYSTAARRWMYRFINARLWVKDLIWGRVYYRRQRSLAPQ